MREDGVVAGLLQIALRLEQLLLRVQHIDVRAHADFLAKHGRVKRGSVRDQRGFQRFHLRDAIGHTEKTLADTLCNRALAVFQILRGALFGGQGLANPRLRATTLVNRYGQGEADLA